MDGAAGLGEGTGEVTFLAQRAGTVEVVHGVEVRLVRERERVGGLGGGEILGPREGLAWHLGRWGASGRLGHGLIRRGEHGRSGEGRLGGGEHPVGEAVGGGREEPLGPPELAGVASGEGEGGDAGGQDGVPHGAAPCREEPIAMPVPAAPRTPSPSGKGPG